MADGHGGAREGAGRKKTEKTEHSGAVAALFELAVGQSSVKLVLDSKNQVKPEVSAYHSDVAHAGRLAEAEFDRLIMKYRATPES